MGTGPQQYTRLLGKSVWDLSVYSLELPLIHKQTHNWISRTRIEEQSFIHQMKKSRTL